MSDTVQKIKEKLSIVDVVSSYVKLTRAGKYWRGLSPFNKEKTPSFFVSPDRGLYHCFSSGKGGDMFTFIQEVENVDFKGALALLAEKAGVPLVFENPSVKDERDRLYDAMKDAEKRFIDLFQKEPEVREYVRGRGLTDASITEWSIGYAPDEWRSLHAHLTERGYTESILERAGLIKKRDEIEGVSGEKKIPQTSSLKPHPSKYYDRFRGRIMFPIHDVSGRTIGFSGRIFKKQGASAMSGQSYDQAKYLNSPETPIFDKSSVLYGLPKAKDAIRRLNASLLVEGQLDLLMAHQAGYRNAVATSGTAFTARHAEILKRYSENLLIVYDGDRAGISASGRAAALALQSGLNVKIAKLPPGEDPADVLQTRPDTFKQAVKQGLHVVDFFLAHILDAKYDTRRFRLEVSRTVLPYIAMIENHIDQAHFIARVAETLGIDSGAVLAEVKKIPRTPSSESPIESNPAEPFLSRADMLERLLIGIRAVCSENNNSAMISRIDAGLRQSLSPDRYISLVGVPLDELRPAIFEAEIFLEQFSDAAHSERAVDEMLEELKREELHEAYRIGVASLREAESTHDDAQTQRLMEELARLAGELHKG